MKKSQQLAQRLSVLLARLNKGERIDISLLAEEFGVSVRTLQRDINQRLDFLEWDEKGGRFYKINQQKSGFLTEEDINRFALLPVSRIYSQKLIVNFTKKNSHKVCK